MTSILKGTDGVAFDDAGTLYGANIAHNALLRVGPNGHVSPLAKDGSLQSPSSIAFGTAHSDRHTLYVANFSIYQVLGSIPPGQLNTGILTLRVNQSGLPLPVMRRRSVASDAARRALSARDSSSRGQSPRRRVR